jgi:hypothetical protein
VPKILWAKIDGLCKHAGRKRALFDIPKFNVAKGEYCIDTICQHLKNERLVFSLQQASVVQQLAVSRNVVRRKKFVQLVLHLIGQGRPMTDYGAALSLFKMLQVPDLPLKHWSEDVGWEVAVA